MLFNQELFDKVREEAKANSRLLMSRDMRTTSEDGFQRMINVLETRTVEPIHRHRNSSETMIVVCGRLLEEIYDE